MINISIFQKIKDFVGAVSFKIFLWSISMTKEEYWNAIYEQEKELEKRSMYVIFTKGEF